VADAQRDTFGAGNLDRRRRGAHDERRSDGFGLLLRYHDTMHARRALRFE
jgi:hypothetical protein